MGILTNGLINSIKDAMNIEGGAKLYAITYGLALFAMIISYLLGSLSSAIIVSKALYKEDIRTHGSGNAGLTNMLRTYGKGAAALTLVGDMLKTVLAIGVTGLIFGFSYSRGISLSGFLYLSGLWAVVGHVFPIFYGFKGGKGVLVTATMALILTPIVFATLLAIFIIVVVITRYVSLGSIIVATLFPLFVCLYSYFIGGGISMLAIMCSLILAIFVIWCHRSNIARLKNGSEKRISVGKKEKN